MIRHTNCDVWEVYMGSAIPIITAGTTLCYNWFQILDPPAADARSIHAVMCPAATKQLQAWQFVFQLSSP